MYISVIVCEQGLEKPSSSTFFPAFLECDATNITGAVFELYACMDPIQYRIKAEKSIGKEIGNKVWKSWMEISHHCSIISGFFILK